MLYTKLPQGNKRASLGNVGYRDGTAVAFQRGVGGGCFMFSGLMIWPGVLTCLSWWVRFFLSFLFSCGDCARPFAERAPVLSVLVVGVSRSAGPTRVFGLFCCSV